MSTGPAGQRLWVYFVVDRTGEMRARIALFEEQLNGLIESLKRAGVDSRVSPRVIPMEAVTTWILEQPMSRGFRLADESPGCDLGRALDLLIKSLRAARVPSEEQVEVFVLLNSEPAGDWESLIRPLQKKGVHITAIAFGPESRVQKETLRRIRSPSRQALRSGALNRPNVERVFAHISEFLSSRLGPKAEVPTASAQVSPPVPKSQPPAQVQQLQPSVKASQPQPPPSTEEPQPPAGVPEEMTRRARSPEPSIAPVGHGAGVPGDEAAPVGDEVGETPATPGEAALPAEGHDEAGVPKVHRRRPAETVRLAELHTGEGDAGVPSEIVQDDAVMEGPGVAVSDIMTGQALLDQTPSEPSGEPGLEEEIEETTEEAGLAVKAGPPPVGEGGVATIWKDVEPPPDLGDRVDHVVTDDREGADGWRMIGASRRGKMHAHKGIFREDAFALGVAEGWHLMVVADGGGSCSLSRVGSHVAATTAVDSMAELVQSVASTPSSAEEICRMALRKGLEDAWEALSTEAQSREIPLRELGTTFLALMHHPDPEGDVVGVMQVGDGLVAFESADDKIKTLAEPDVGETAGVTLFLTSRPWQEWLDRIWVGRLPEPPRLLTAMCDGVADDFIPFDLHLRKLFDGLAQVIENEVPSEALLQLLGYEKRGSFDDRTLALVYQAGAEPDRGVELEARPETESPIEEQPPEGEVQAPGSVPDSSALGEPT